MTPRSLPRRTATRTLALLGAAVALAGSLAAAGCAAPTPPPPPAPLQKLGIVLGSNLGHLPILVGYEKGFFRQHGLDLQLKIVNNGSEMVSAMQKREVELGDMSVTTFIKARHEGDPLQVVGFVMNDATRANADEPLAIVSKKGSGIRPGMLDDLKGKRVAVMLGQTPHEYLKILMARKGFGPGDLQIVDVPQQAPLMIEALASGKVDAVASLEPLNTLVLRGVPDAFEVTRGGGYLSYMMITTAQIPMIRDQADLMVRFNAGLAAASQYTRQHRSEAVDIFAKYVPGLDRAAVATGIRHISYDPRMSAATDQAFSAAQTDVLSQPALKDKTPMPLDALLYRTAIVSVEKQYPQYFSDLPKLP